MRKHYKVNWQDGRLVSIEVNGVTYDSPDQVPDRADRAAVARLMAHRPRPRAGDLFDEQEFAEDMARLQRETAQMPKVIVAVFAAVALVMLAVAAVSTVATARMLAREQSAPGWVVDLVPRSGSDGQVLYYPLVEFVMADGRTQRVTLSDGSVTPAVRRGEEIVVRYDPMRPSQARIPSLGSTVMIWLVPLITGLLAVAFVGATALSMWMFQSELRASAGG